MNKCNAALMRVYLVLYFYFLFFALIRHFKMCFSPQFAACFAPQGHGNIHYQSNVFLNGVLGFPVIGWYFIE